MATHLSEPLSARDSSYGEHDEKQRVLHVVYALDFGGVEKHMETIARSARDSNFEHCFCALTRGGSAEQIISAEGARVWCLEEPGRIPNWRTTLATYRLVKRLRPAVVHAHGAEANFHGLLAAWLARVPVRIGEEIGIPGHSTRARLVFRQVYRTATRVIGISNSVADYLLEAGEVKEQRLVRLYNPVEPLVVEETVSDTDRTGPTRLCHVGRLHPVKNLTMLLDALAQVNGSGQACELWLIGDGPQRQELENRTLVLGLDGLVHFFGYQREPGTFLAQCDVLVQVSVAEGFGLALVEGLGAGLPAIVTRVGAGPELVEQGKTGWLVSPDNVDDIAAAIEEACRLGRSQLSAMGEAAKQSVGNRFSPPAYIGRLENLYSSLLEKEISSATLTYSGEAE